MMTTVYERIEKGEKYNIKIYTPVREKILHFSRYFSEVFTYTDYDNESHVLIIAPTNSGKTSAIINQALQTEEYLLIVCSELVPAMQVAKQYDLPLYCKDTEKLFSELPNKCVTIYNHLEKFHTGYTSQYTVILDESHCLITDQAFRENIIDDIQADLTVFPKIRLLTGTHLKSQYFERYLHIIGVSKQQNNKLALINYDNELATIIEITKKYVLENKKVMIYLQNISQQLSQLIDAFNNLHISITILNSGTIKNDNEVITQEIFSTDVLITSYRQSYNINMENVVFISADCFDIVSIVQAIARVRQPLYKAFLLTNANYDNAVNHNFNELYLTLQSYYTGVISSLLHNEKDKLNDYLSLQAVMKKQYTDMQNLLKYQMQIDNLKLAYYVYRDICNLTKKNLYLLISGLTTYNITIEKDLYRVNEQVLPLTKINTEIKQEKDTVLLKHVFDVLKPVETLKKNNYYSRIRRKNTFS